MVFIGQVKLQHSNYRGIPDFQLIFFQLNINTDAKDELQKQVGIGTGNGLKTTTISKTVNYEQR